MDENGYPLALNPEEREDRRDGEDFRDRDTTDREQDRYDKQVYDPRW